MIAFRHLALRAQDIQRSRQFYTTGLGMTFVGFRPDGKTMDLANGAVNLTLIPYDGPPRRALEEGAEFIHFGFVVGNLAEVYQRLLALGAPVVRDDVKERRLHEDGGVPLGSFKALDPDGNVVDVSERPDEWRV
jgi:catechol 2,3-dioxygenase-like lactoylglutathione lyase family enzyme